MITILIADNQMLTCKGIYALLADVEDICIAGQATTLDELDHLALTLKPDVLVIDHNYCTHFNSVVIERIIARFDFIKILILSNKQPRTGIMEIIDQGIKNYISKDCSGQEFVNAVYATARGEQFYCSQTLQTLFGDNIKLKKANNIPLLSDRETEIVQLIAEGMPNKIIAEKLFLSIHTIRTHRKNIIKKLGFTFKHASELILLLSYLNDIFI